MSVADINAVAVTGRVVADSELRLTQNGKSVLTFSVASNERVPGTNGEFEDHSNFFDCVIFGTYAESAQRFIKKGMPVSINGHLRFSKYEHYGEMRSRIEIYVDRIVVHDRFCSSAVR